MDILTKGREDNDDNICFLLWKKNICQICQHTSTTQRFLPIWIPKGAHLWNAILFLFLLPQLWWWTAKIIEQTLFVQTYSMYTNMRKFPISIYPCCGLSNHKQNIKCSSIITFTLVIKNIRGWFIKCFVPIIMIITTTTTTTSTAVDKKASLWWIFSIDHRRMIQYREFNLWTFILSYQQQQ